MHRSKRTVTWLLAFGVLSPGLYQLVAGCGQMATGGGGSNLTAEEVAAALEADVVNALLANAAFLAATQGREGPAGPQGETGEQGPAGPQGEAGPQGLPGNANVESFSFDVLAADWDVGFHYGDGNVYRGYTIARTGRGHELQRML